MDYRRLIPNMCTSSNLVFGMCSILSTYSGNLVWGSIFILLALVADGLDGRTARFFGVASEMGKEMDSLCDLGSFGIAPAFLAWAFVLHNHGFLGVVVAIFFAICGMWRLARFNVNASVVHGYFMGLAIPAGGNIVAMTTLLFVELGVDPMTFGIAYPIVMAFVGWLMVSHVHYPLLKGDVDNWYEVTDLLRHYNVRLCIGGHYHSMCNHSYDGIPGVLLRSNIREHVRFTVE